MNKTYGVCVGMLAMGLAVFGAPASRAAGDPGSGSETSTTSAVATPAASSPADLDRRIEALETELSELRTVLAAKKEAEPARVLYVLLISASNSYFLFQQSEMCA